MIFAYTLSCQHIPRMREFIQTCLTSYSASICHSDNALSHLRTGCKQVQSHHTGNHVSASLTARNVTRPTFVLRWPQGTHACETRCRALMSRGMRSRNRMLVLRKRVFGYRCELHGRRDKDSRRRSRPPPGMMRKHFKSVHNIDATEQELIRAKFLLDFASTHAHSRSIADAPPSTLGAVQHISRDLFDATNILVSHTYASLPWQSNV